MADDYTNFFEELYSKYKERLYNLCKRILKNNQDANDAFQEGLLVIWSKADKYDITRPLYPWVKGIMRNTCFTMNRRVNSYRKNFVEYDEGTIVDESTPISWEQDRAFIKKAIDCLPVDIQTIMAAHFIEGLSLEKIAEQSQLNIKEVENQLQIGVIILRDLYYEY